MNKYIYTLCAAMSLGTMLTSCNKEENFSLQDTLMLEKALIAQGEGFNDELYSFNLELASDGITGSAGQYTGSGDVISLNLFGSKYFLDTSIYSPIAEGQEKDCSYLLKDSKYYSVTNGQVSESTIEKGFIYVSKDGNNYRISSTLTVSGGKTVKFIATCSIDFPKLPKYKYMGQFIQAYDAGEVYIVEFANGTVKTGDGGQMEGSGTIVHIEIPGASSLADGIYKPGDYKAGFLNTTYAAWGAVWDEGSRLTEVTDGAQQTSGYITEATITVSTLANGDRRIEVDMDDIVYVYEGKI